MRSHTERSVRTGQPPSRAVAIVLALLCALAIAAIANSLTENAQAAASPTPALDLTGYQEESSPTGLIGTDAAAMTDVGVDGSSLTASGHRFQATDPTALAQLAAAHARHLPASLLVSNFSDAINDFSEPLAHRLLSDPAATDAVAEQLRDAVLTQHWQGITVDFESLTHRDESGLTRLVAALRHTLPTGISLGVDVMNSTSAAQYPATGYDLRALARSATELVLMAYDEHGTWESAPGPVGALAWQRAGLRAMLAQVPAAKLVLGVAGYGYGWEPHQNIQVGDAQARAISARAGVTPSFNATVGEWTATLPDGGVLWWSDARSLALRITLARHLHLRGLAVWDLALSDPLG